MRIHSRQTDRRRSSAVRFQNTIGEFLRLSRLEALAHEDRDNGRAENCNKHRPPLSARRSSLDNLLKNRSAAKWVIGWKRSTTTNTADDLANDS